MDWWIIYHLFLFLGASQGIILGLSLWFSPSERKKSNRFLASLLFFFAYRLAAELLRSTGIASTDNWAYHILLEYNWIYGALIYFFVLSYIRSDYQLKRNDYWHFLPVALEFLFSNWVKIQNFYWDGNQESLSWFGAQSYILWVHTPFSNIVSFSLVIWYVYQSQQLLKEESLLHAPANVKQLKWLRQVLMTYFVFSILVIFIHFADYLFFNYAFDPFYRFPTYIGMALITYWMALEGYSRRKEIPLKREVLSNDKMEGLQKVLPKLEKLMIEEKLFLNPNLSLADLAKHLDIKPYLLTQVLNRLLQKSFNDYVNAYRVKEAARLINDPDYAHYSLMAIALESGFNSKATFNRIFKKIEGISPSAFKAQ